MTHNMTLKGHTALIEYDDEGDFLTDRITGSHADAVEDLRSAFHEVVEDYLETCARIGKVPRKAYSGKVMFRVSPEVHRKAALAAELSGKSPSQWATVVSGRTIG